jgi:acetoin utilization protein AcuC
MNRTRTRLFEESLRRAAAVRDGGIRVIAPKRSRDEDLVLFHTQRYVDFVKEASKAGEGYLDFPDTPAFPGVYEASLYSVGSTLYGMEAISDGSFDHFFNPVGGLHHAARDRASGFCVFNDAAIAVAKALKTGFDRVAYVDIDAHHGDGVYYGFESDPRVIIADIHEDGRTLFPGTGAEGERGKGEAVGSKLNIPLRAGSGDREFFEAFERVRRFIEESRPQFILFQCGADGLRGDPLSHLRYSAAAHALASERLHELAHDLCDGHIMALGGGGYSADNVDAAWSAVVAELSGAVRGKAYHSRQTR